MTKSTLSTVIICIVTVFFSKNIVAQKVQLSQNQLNRSVDVLVDGKPFTSYLYLDTATMKKPILFPVRTEAGTLVTRGWPLEPRAYERVDHPHHVGVWLNYEDINGIDFWNNSDKVNRNRKHYGTILHTGIKQIKSGNRKGVLEVTANWLDQNGKVILEELTRFEFIANGKQRIIDRKTTLKAVNEKVEMKDVKDGFFAIRVARELDHPSQNPEIRTDANGHSMSVKTINNEAVTGSFRNKEGVEGEEAWGKSSAWCNLRGIINGENISVAIIDHPLNFGYPSYWHARGYGLYGINPLGVRAYDKSKRATQLSLEPEQAVTFRFRLVIDSKHLTDMDMNKLAKQFATKK